MCTFSFLTIVVRLQVCAVSFLTRHAIIDLKTYFCQGIASRTQIY